MAQTELLHVLLSQIIEPDEGLRKVDPSTEQFLEMVESVRVAGIMNPINIRRFNDGRFGLVDGLQRLTAARYAGLETIPAQVISVADGDLMEAQILANIHKIETRPVEYSRGLLAILQANPFMTRSELSAKLAKTSAWLSERLGLLKLTEEIGKMVDAEQIGLSNAYSLAKLQPPEEQAAFVDRAISMPSPQFMATVNGRVKELRDAKRQGRDAKPAEFTPIAILRGRADLIEEMNSKSFASTLTVKNNINDPVTAFQMGIKWALNLDPDSIIVQTAKDAERKVELARKNADKTEERRKQRASEAADKAAKLQHDVDEALKAKIAAGLK
jgi:ParB/RepB/Spo0J family partition protein